MIHQVAGDPVPIVLSILISEFAEKISDEELVKTAARLHKAKQRIDSQIT